MEFEPIFYACLLLCVTAFLEVLYNFRKNSLLKVCFLLIIASLFVMNYFSFVTVSSRLQVVLVKTVRLVYVCSTMLCVVHLVTTQIPRWLIILTSLSCFLIVGLRIYYFNQIDIESQRLSNQVFSVGTEFQTPHLFARYVIFTLATIALSITFYYYRIFLIKINRESAYYKRISRWVMCLVTPFFLLTIFGVLGNLNLIQKTTSPYLFLVFSCTILFSILLRPRVLNTSLYGEISRGFSVA